MANVRARCRPIAWLVLSAQERAYLSSSSGPNLPTNPRGRSVPIGSADRLTPPSRVTIVGSPRLPHRLGGPSAVTICANTQPRMQLRPSLQEQPGNNNQDADRRDVPHERTS